MMGVREEAAVLRRWEWFDLGGVVPSISGLSLFLHFRLKFHAVSGSRISESP